MIIITCFNLFLVLCGYLANYCNDKRFVKVAFFFLFFALAFRYDFGNDYLAYNQMFYEIKNGIRDTQVEYGWELFNRLCSPFSFQFLIVIWSFIYCIVFCDFILKYVPPKWYWLSIFLLVFDPYNMLVHVSMLRQSLAIIIFVYSFGFLLEKKIFHYIFFILLASSFHTTALILLPVGLLMYLNVTFKYWHILLLLLLFISSFIYIEQIKIFIIKNILGELPKYADAYMGQEKELGQGRAIFIKSLILFICLIYQKRFNSEGLLSSKLYYIGFYFIPLATIILMLTRLGQYFLIFGILLIPLSFSVIKSVYVKILLFTLVIFITLYDYIGFFNFPTWIEKYSVYKTFFNLAM